MDIEDDDFGQEAERVETSHSKDKRELLMGEWLGVFAKLELYEPELANAWVASHREDIEDTDQFIGLPVWLELKPGARQPVSDNPRYQRFLSGHQSVLLRLNALDREHRGRTLDEIDDSGANTYVLDGAIPYGQITFLYGSPKAGKSAFAQKITVCIGSKATEFDGDPVPHGRVLYVTLDPGARQKQVKARMMQIYQRLDIKPGPNVILVDDVVLLDQPDSITSLLSKNPGNYMLVIIDPLYKALSGNPSNPNIINAAMDGLKRICVETGAGVLVIHHDTRANEPHLFGSIFLEAGADALLHMKRSGDKVTIDAQWLKNDEPRERPLIYTLNGPYLSRSADAAVTADAVTRPDMLALIPNSPTSIRQARKLIEHLLISQGTRNRDQEWVRIRKIWEKAKAIIQGNGMMQRVEK